MKIFKYKNFANWSKSENLTDEILGTAVQEIMQGLFEANLGSGLYKKRVARKGAGKRGGYRTLIAYKENDRVVFMYGFAKNEKENISTKEKDVYKKLARYYINATDTQLKHLIQDGELIEVIPCKN